MRNLRSTPLILLSLTLTLIFVLTGTADAQKKKPRPIAPIAPITADKIKNDLTGEMVYGVPSEEAGEGLMNWQFSYDRSNQVEILRNNSYGNQSTVDARIYAQKANSDFDGSVDRLRGIARLHYERSGGRWQLTRIENISLRHSDNGSDSPAYPVYPGPQNRTAPASATSIVPGGVTVSVDAGKFRTFSFRVADRAVVTGRFQARGGTGNDIEAYILDNDGFINWSNNHGAPTYYNSGRLTVGTIKTPLSAGTYYLVFNNRYSPEDAKTVEVSVEMKTDNAFYNETGRVYAPNARPAPSYNPPATPNPVTTLNPFPDDRGQPRVSEVAGLRVERIELGGTFEVRQRKDKAFYFVVKNRGSLKGNFRVLYGEGNIEALIMTADEYNNWSHYREATVNYSSGRVTNGRINKNLNPGAYYLVFSNYYSSDTTKTIEADAYVEYLDR